LDTSGWNRRRRVPLLLRHLRAGRSGLPALPATARGRCAVEGAEDPQWPLRPLPGTGPGGTQDLLSDLVGGGAHPLEQPIPDLMSRMWLQGAAARHRLQRAAGLVGPAVRRAGDAGADRAQRAGHAVCPESAGTFARAGAAGQPAAGAGAAGPRAGTGLTLTAWDSARVWCRQ